ncbi:MAG: hypothetical protein WBY53_03200 [Acidobacteriaceae bacterium]
MRTPIRAILTALLLAPLPALAQNLTIASVTFHNPGPYTSAELLTTSGLHPGQFLLRDSLVNAAKNLLNTGLFTDAQFDYTGAGRSKAVVVDLKPIPLDKLLPASFTNLVWFTPDELTAGIHTAVPLYRGVASDAGNLPDAIQSALQQMLAAKGITATLSHTIAEPTSANPIRLVTFTVDDPAIRLLTVHLSMVGPPGAAAALAPALQQAANHATRAPFNEGLTGAGIQNLLLDPIRNAGYIQASLDNIQRTLSPSPSNPKVLLVTYTARILTGDPYKVSTLTWNPTPVYSAADFANNATLHPGDLANASALLLTEASIAKPYLRLGYMDVYILSHPAPDATTHTVAYTLEPIPGEIYHLKSVTPTGLSPDAQKAFDSAWQLKPGEVYSDLAVGDFLRKNVAQPAFRPYSVSFRASADPQTHLVDLALTFFRGAQ